MNTQRPDLPHTVTLRDRSSLHISGVCEVLSFDDVTVSLRTTRGTMTIEGADLHITTLDIDRGEVILDGTVNGLFYAGDGSEKTGFLNRLFG